MKEKNFHIGPLQIKAQSTIPAASNLAYRFIQLFQDELFKLLQSETDINQIEVYNLTINGSGRYYYLPALNVLRMYILNDFVPVAEYEMYTEDISKNLP